MRGRAGYLSLQKLFDVVGKRETQGFRPPGELSMKTIGDISNLNHLGHVLSMSHVSHMVKSDFPLPKARQRARFSSEAGCTLAIDHMIYCGPQKLEGGGRKMAKRNLTVELDDEMIRKAKVVAAKRGTSVSRLVANKLEDLIEADVRYEEARERALKALANAKPRGGRSWRREELHQR